MLVLIYVKYLCSWLALESSYCRFIYGASGMGDSYRSFRTQCSYHIESRADRSCYCLALAVVFYNVKRCSKAFVNPSKTPNRQEHEI